MNLNHQLTQDRHYLLLLQAIDPTSFVDLLDAVASGSQPLLIEPTIDDYVQTHFNAHRHDKIVGLTEALQHRPEWQQMAFECIGAKYVGDWRYMNPKPAEDQQPIHVEEMAESSPTTQAGQTAAAEEPSAARKFVDDMNSRLQLKELELTGFCLDDYSAQVDHGYSGWLDFVVCGEIEQVQWTLSRPTMLYGAARLDIRLPAPDSKLASPQILELTTAAAYCVQHLPAQLQQEDHPLVEFFKNLQVIRLLVNPGSSFDELCALAQIFKDDSYPINTGHLGVQSRFPAAQMLVETATAMSDTPAAEVPTTAPEKPLMEFKIGVPRGFHRYGVTHHWFIEELSLSTGGGDVTKHVITFGFNPKNLIDLSATEEWKTHSSEMILREFRSAFGHFLTYLEGRGVRNANIQVCLEEPVELFGQALPFVPELTPEHFFKLARVQQNHGLFASEVKVLKTAYKDQPIFTQNTKDDVVKVVAPLSEEGDVYTHHYFHQDFKHRWHTVTLTEGEFAGKLEARILLDVKWLAALTHGCPLPGATSAQEIGNFLKFFKNERLGKFINVDNVAHTRFGVYQPEGWAAGWDRETTTRIMQEIHWLLNSAEQLVQEAGISLWPFYQVSKPE